jgi:Mrp family chromosome partitioning ATPase
VSNSPGLSDVLAGRATLEDAIQQTPFGNLFVLPSGTCHEINSAELLNSNAANKVFDEIRERFHYTLVDTPPVQALSDVGVIGALCSGLVMVVRMNKTGAHVVRQSLHWLQANNLQVLGCIAADCSAKGARYEYDGNDDD